MHEELRVSIEYRNYVNAFYKWVEFNKGKLSVEFDKEIGIGKWKKINGETTIEIKDYKKYLIAKLKYEL